MKLNYHNFPIEIFFYWTKGNLSLGAENYDFLNALKGDFELREKKYLIKRTTDLLERVE